MANRMPPPHAGLLAAFGTAAAHPRSLKQEFVTAKEALAATLGAQGLVDASCVAALFAGISRIVDATGLPDDPPEKYAMMEFAQRRVVPGVAVGVMASVVALGFLLGKRPLAGH